MRIRHFVTVILFIISYSCLQSQNWIQIGKDLDGKNKKDYFGTSLCLSDDGTTLAIGAPNNDDNGKDSGSLKVFKLMDNQWIQIGQDIIGASQDNYFGYSVSLNFDGTIVAVGASRNSDNGRNSGEVRVFKFNGAKWIQLGSDLEGKSPNDYFGVSVSLSSDGSIVAIGATKSFIKKNIGQVSIFKFKGDNWYKVGHDILGNNKNEFFGGKVSLSSDGRIIAIGAYNNKDNGKETGHVRIFEYKSDTWKQIGSNLVGKTKKDMFGWSLDINYDGSIVAIGAPALFDKDKKGYVSIYKEDNGIWSQIGKDISGDNFGDNFGYSLSLSSDGSIFAVGAIFNDGINGENSGQVKVYRFQEDNWIQLGKDIEGEDGYDYSGYSISINSKGNIIAIGATGNKSKGHGRVFKLSNE